MKLPRLEFKTILSTISIPFIALAVFAAGSDALLGMQVLLGAMGVAGGGAGFIIGCLAISAIVALFYLIQDGVTLWRRLRGEKDEDEAEQENSFLADNADKTVDLKKASFWRLWWEGIIVFWFGENTRSRAYRVGNFFGRLVSFIGAFAAGGGAFLAVQTLLTFFGVVGGPVALALCSLGAIGFAFAFISQDGFSLVKRLRDFAEYLAKPRTKSLRQSLIDFWQALTWRKVVMSMVTVMLVAIAALAVTGDAFLGVQTLLVAMGLAAPQVALLLSVTLAIFLGVIYIAQEGFSLTQMLNTFSEKIANIYDQLVNKLSGRQALSTTEVTTKSEADLARPIKTSLKATTAIFSLAAGFAVAGGAYLGLSMLFTSIGFTGVGMIALVATASVVAGLGFIAQDGGTFYGRLKGYFTKKMAVATSDETDSSDRVERRTPANASFSEEPRSPSRFSSGGPQSVVQAAAPLHEADATDCDSDDEEDDNHQLLASTGSTKA